MKVLAVVFLLATLIWSQNPGSKVSGKITLDKSAVANVVVTLIGAGDDTRTTTSNAEGSFEFSNLPAGTYKIAVAQTLAPQREVTLGVGESATADFELDSADLNQSSPAISALVTIAADANQPIEAVAKTVDVIDGQELRDRADFALVDSLRTVPGFRVQQLGGFGRIASVKTRGLRSQDTAILIDGLRFRDASSITGDASAFLSDFTLTSVARLEVLRGSGSSLYGTNAIGGTVDFQTARPAAGPHGQFSAAVGELGLRRFRGNISDATKDERIGYTLAISRTVYTKGIDGNDDAHNTNAQGRFEFAPTSRSNVSGRIFVSDAFVRLNAGPDTLGPAPAQNRGVIDADVGRNFVPDADDPDSTQRSKFFNGQAVYSASLADKVLFEASYSGLTTSRRNDDGPLGPGFQSAYTSFFDGSIQTANAKLTWVPSEINRLTGGYEFERETFRNVGETPSGAGNFTTRAGQASQTLFAQDAASLLGGRLQLAGGVRFQFFSLDDPRFSLINAPYTNLTAGRPPAALTFDGSGAYFFRRSRTKLRAHAGNGYRVPSLYERFGTFFSSFGTPSFVALGDPELKPEKTIAFDAGLDQQIGGGDKLNLSATYFYTRLTRTIAFGNVVRDIGSTPRPFGGYVNAEGGIARGGEFSLRAKPFSATKLFASYTFTNSDQRSPQVTGSGVIDTLGIPAHQFSIVATQNVKRFWVNADFVATSSYLAPIFSSTSFATYVYRFGGGRRADLTAGYTFPLNGDKASLKIFGTVENVFDYQYFENGFRTVGRNSRIAAAISF